jgi:integrase
MPFKSKKAADRVVRYTTKDGEVREYRYPRKKQKPEKAQRFELDSIEALIKAYKMSPEWKRLSPRTQEAYSHQHSPLNHISHLRVHQLTRRDVLHFRDVMAEARGPGAALCFARAVSALFAWGVDRQWLDISPCTRITRGLENGHWPAWTQEQADRALKVLPEHLRRVVLLALHTGQRRGDLCALQWNAYDGHTIRLVQQKTKAELVVPVPGLVKELNGWKACTTSTYILTNPSGRPWRANALSKALEYHLRTLGFPSRLNVHGLRKLSAARLAQAGCSVHEIMAITGHRSLAMIKLYTDSAEQKTLAQAAVIRLEKAFGQKRTKRQTTPATA